MSQMPAERPSWERSVLRWRVSPLDFVLEAMFGITRASWAPWVPGTERPVDAPVGPEQWQGLFLRDVGLAVVEGRRRFSVRAGHGVGKAQPKDLMIDTPTGRRRFGDLVAGDMVFGQNGKPTRILAVHERGVLPVYRVTFEDQTSTLACADHLWSVRGRNDRRTKVGWRTLATHEIERLGVRRGNGSNEARQWEVPTLSPV